MDKFVYTFIQGNIIHTNKSRYNSQKDTGGHKSTYGKGESKQFYKAIYFYGISNITIFRKRQNYTDSKRDRVAVCGRALNGQHKHRLF